MLFRILEVLPMHFRNIKKKILVGYCVFRAYVKFKDGDFHQLGPLGRVGLVVAQSTVRYRVCL